MLKMTLKTFYISCLLVSTGVAVAALATRKPPAEPPTPAYCKEGGSWLSLSTMPPKPAGVQDIVANAAKQDVVLLGEQHDIEDHHRWQLQMLSALLQWLAAAPVAVWQAAVAPPWAMAAGLLAALLAVLPLPWRLRALGPAVAAYVDYALQTPGVQRHRFLRERVVAIQFRRLKRGMEFGKPVLNGLEKMLTPFHAFSVTHGCP